MVKDKLSSLRGSLRWAIYKFNGRVMKRLFPNSGEDFVNQDWDNLILLDACRYDLFNEYNPFDRDPKPILSKGAESWEFMKANYERKQLHNTVLVTANPHTARLSSDTFHAIWNLLETDWDREDRIVHPEDVVAKALQAQEAFPNKRLIIHLMQPHFPFLGPTGDELNHMGVNQLDADDTLDAPNPWIGLISDPSVPNDKIVKAYRENYEIVLPHVEELVEELIGKTVVSADHANLLGERTFPIPLRTYGHPTGVRRSELLQVPWLEFESKTRPELREESPVENKRLDDEDVEQRLADLGYR